MLIGLYLSGWFPRDGNREKPCSPVTSAIREKLVVWLSRNPSDKMKVEKHS